jgi:hypothetical protein
MEKLDMMALLDEPEGEPGDEDCLGEPEVAQWTLVPIDDEPQMSCHFEAQFEQRTPA